MDYTKIDLMIQEATKHLIKDSHSEVHNRLQQALSSEHRSAYDGSDWETYPQVHHVFGDKDKGHVIYRQGENHYRAPYKMDNGGYSLGTPQSVQMAYVPADQSVSEAIRDIPYVVQDGIEAFREALAQVMERFISQAERRTMPKEDFAGKGDSFPISNSEDVRAALDSIGRAGNGNYAPEELKSRILSIAKRKGLAIPKSDKTNKESAVDVEETTVLQESVAGSSNSLIKLISPGTGSMGHYSEDVLREAAKNRIFPAGTRMFLDHQTAEERARRPEGEVGKWAATTTKDAEYQENGPDGPGLYAHASVYDSHKAFIKERAKDLGVSIRAGVTTTGKLVGGVPEVKEMKHGLSADFVTRAGRGGKVVEMYESFRSQAGNTQEGENMTEQEKQDFAALKTRMDRLTEDNNRLRATHIIGEAFAGSGLKPRAQERAVKELTASLPVDANGVLDIVKLQESAKKFVQDEVAYLQESGIRVSPFVVRGNGGVESTQEQKNGDKILQEAQTDLDKSIDALMGRKEKTA